ncbi:L,D-transpeptidase family protein [Sphingomonas sp. FW199]|uniref:L,D-transpeptidase family protein n=1 Tax=Sphingomonas sp. FW199 TaxID=3400217 RepID=UPI003CF5177D
MCESRLILTLCAVVLTLISGGIARAAEPADLPMPVVAVERMRPGDHRWFDDAGAAGPVAIVISIPMQKALVYRGDRLIGISTVSTGKRGKETPIGEFTILQKKVFHRSNLYSNAPMPYMQRLTWTGIALHAGQLPGYPASHGCIRFPLAFARRLYQETEMGGTVAVTDRPIAVLRHPDRPLPPPIIEILPDPVNDARFNMVVAANWVAVAPGEVAFGPARPVIQPIPAVQRVPRRSRYR